MKQILTYFFVTLGVIFFVLLCALAYLWFADPLEIRPLIATLSSAPEVQVRDAAPIVSKVPVATDDAHPLLSDTQEAALEAIGINPENLPKEITPAMELCFVDTLGEVRVNEIKAGDAPTAIEVFTTRTCYE